MAKRPAPKRLRKAPSQEGKKIKRPPAKKATAKKPIAKPAKKIDKRGTPRGKGTVRANGGRIGNPPHKPTPELRALARDLAAYGLPHWAIAEMMKVEGKSISEDTLERHYSNELAIGVHSMNAKASQMVAKGVLSGDKDYVRFWLARRGGPAWTNKQAHEHTTPPGRPMETRDMTGLSEAELAALAALDKQSDAAGGD